MEYKDKTMKCKDCGEDFVFTARDQEFYAEKGFQNEPQRCKACRDKKKLERGNGNGRNFGGNKPSFGSRPGFSKPGFGGKPSFGGKPGFKSGNSSSRGGNFHRNSQRGA